MSHSPAPFFEDRKTKSPPDDDDDDDDPIVATYSLFTKPPLAGNRELTILQYVNKTASDPTQIRPLQIQDVRLKPKTGMYEVDVPLDTAVAYDQSKGIKWGSDLQKSMETKKGGSLGLAGGFGIGAPVNRAGGGRRAAAEEENLTWQEANRLDKVLRTQTLGGGRSAAEETAGFMVGVIKGKNIHLTPITSLVNLRPVPHHLDASSEQEKLARPLPGGAAAAATAAKKNAANAIQMTLKGAMDDEGVATETMADRLRSVQNETWRTMEWYHDETEGAWQAYNECLFLSSGDTAAAEVDEDDKGKGKAVDGPPADSGLSELKEKVAPLETPWREDELLRGISGIKRHDKKPGEEAVEAAAAASAVPVVKKEAQAPVRVAEVEQAEAAKRRPGRPAKPAPKPAARARPGTRGGGGSGPSDAMQVD